MTPVLPQGFGQLKVVFHRKAEQRPKTKTKTKMDLFMAFRSFRDVHTKESNLGVVRVVYEWEGKKRDVN